MEVFKIRIGAKDDVVNILYEKCGGERTKHMLRTVMKGNLSGIKALNAMSFEEDGEGPVVEVCARQTELES